MPYRSQGIATAEGSKRIELKKLFKSYIKKGYTAKGVMSWTDSWDNETGSIGIETCFLDNEKWIRLKYSITNNQGEQNNFDYKVYLMPVKSNLGIGKVYYLQCPVSNQLCRVLYMAYGSHYFKCRSAYQNRIYYESQRVSKVYYPTNRYYKLEKMLEDMNKTRMKKTYKGKITKSYERYLKRENECNYFDNARWSQMGILLKKFEKCKKK